MYAACLHAHALVLLQPNGEGKNRKAHLETMNVSRFSFLRLQMYIVLLAGGLMKSVSHYSFLVKLTILI